MHPHHTQSQSQHAQSWPAGSFARSAQWPAAAADFAHQAATIDALYANYDRGAIDPSQGFANAEYGHAGMPMTAFDPTVATATAAAATHAWQSQFQQLSAPHPQQHHQHHHQQQYQPQSPNHSQHSQHHSSHSRQWDQSQPQSQTESWRGSKPSQSQSSNGTPVANSTNTQTFRSQDFGDLYLTPGLPVHWCYTDPQHQVQGPFDEASMRAWYENLFFDLKLPVQCSNEERPSPSLPFIPLGLWFVAGKKAFLSMAPDAGVVAAAKAAVSEIPAVYVSGESEWRWSQPQSQSQSQPQQRFDPLSQFRAQQQLLKQQQLLQFQRQLQLQLLAQQQQQVQMASLIKQQQQQIQSRSAVFDAPIADTGANIPTLDETIETINRLNNSLSPLNGVHSFIPSHVSVGGDAHIVTNMDSELSGLAVADEDSHSQQSSVPTEAELNSQHHERHDSLIATEAEAGSQPDDSETSASEQSVGYEQRPASPSTSESRPHSATTNGSMPHSSLPAWNGAAMLPVRSLKDIQREEESRLHSRSSVRPATMAASSVSVSSSPSNTIKLITPIQPVTALQPQRRVGRKQPKRTTNTSTSSSTSAPINEPASDAAPVIAIYPKAMLPANGAPSIRVLDAEEVEALNQRSKQRSTNRRGPTRKPASTTTATTTPTVTAAASASPSSAFGVSMSGEFERWCVDTLEPLTGNRDLTLPYFLLTLDSPEHIRESVYELLGSSTAATKFAEQFVAMKEFEAEAEAAHSRHKDAKPKVNGANGLSETTAAVGSDDDKKAHRRKK